MVKWNQKKSKKGPWGEAAGVGVGAQTTITSQLPVSGNTWKPKPGSKSVGQGKRHKK